ncbi:MAG: hypothetical protein Q7J68_06675, partial [Thermoplasmata archaeon]|nr:hypothetical protein [Thermoplasmata archaeon]
MKSFLIGVGMKKTFAILTVIVLAVGASAGYMSINGDIDVNENSNNPTVDEDSNTPTPDEDNNNPIANGYIQDFVDDINELNAAIQNLPNSAFKYPPEQRKNAFANKLDAIIELAINGNYTEALNKLEDDIRSKMDGDLGHEDNSSGHGKKPEGHYAGNDWVIDNDAREQLNALIDDIENADYDGDGLSYWDEVKVYGTDPFNPDTDGDGMPDGWEVENGLNPTVDDSMGDREPDGLVNLAEYLNGTDPNDPDSDDDNINDGPEVLTYTTDPNDQDTDDDGLDDGDELDYWNSRVDANWDDDVETTMRGGDGIINILDPDSDNDGLLDGVEVNGWDITIKASPQSVIHVYSDPVLTDTDIDGLSDLIEHDGWDLIVFGITIHVYSNPSSADTDGDDVSDLEEKNINSDPSNTHTYGTYYSDATRAGTRSATGGTVCSAINDGIAENVYITDFKERLIGTGTWGYELHFYQPDDTDEMITVYVGSVDANDVAETQNSFSEIVLTQHPGATDDSEKKFYPSDADGEFSYPLTSVWGWYMLQLTYTVTVSDMYFKYNIKDASNNDLQLSWINSPGITIETEMTFHAETDTYAYFKGGAYSSTSPGDYSFVHEVKVDGNLLYEKAFDQGKYNFPIGYITQGDHTLQAKWECDGNYPAKYWEHICEHSFDPDDVKKSWDTVQITYMGNMHTKDYECWSDGVAVEPAVVRRGSTFMVVGEDSSYNTGNGNVKVFSSGSSTEVSWASYKTKVEDYAGGYYVGGTFTTKYREHWEITVPSNVAVGKYDLKMYDASNTQIGGTTSFYVIFDPYQLVGTSFRKDILETLVYD